VCENIPESQLYYTEDYLKGFFVHDGTGGEYYEYMKSRNMHWSAGSSSYQVAVHLLDLGD